MKIELQVCTLEQAKRLNELGIVQGASLFYYDCGGGIEQLQYNSNINPEGHYADALSCFSAFTVSELGTMLPAGYDTMKATVFSGLCLWHGFDLDGNDFPKDSAFHTEAEARATMLIQLIESESVSVEEINKSLNP